MNKELGFGLELNSTDSGGLVLSRRWLGSNVPIITASHREMRMLAEALMAALGEPVDAKPAPDRSELDRAQSLRYAAIVGGRLAERWRYDVPVEQVIQSAMGYTGEPFSVYELIAYVGPKPQPTERKVVRL